MGIRLIKVISMTDLNNSNADEEHPNAESHDGGNVPSSDANDLDAAWAEFASSHADDLKAVETREVRSVSRSMRSDAKKRRCYRFSDLDSGHIHRRYAAKSWTTRFHGFQLVGHR